MAGKFLEMDISRRLFFVPAFLEGRNLDHQIWSCKDKNSCRTSRTDGKTLDVRTDATRQAEKG